MFWREITLFQVSFSGFEPIPSPFSIASAEETLEA